MRRTVLLLIVATALAGCTTAAGGDTFDLYEFVINGPTALSAATDSVVVTNSGEFSHTLVVTDSNGAVVAATQLIPSGESTTLDLDLEAGNQYSFTCRIVSETPDGEIVDHFEAGMHTTVSAGP